MLTLSLIIPVYNEEHQIENCLDAVASQEVMPDEVIIVDNNCTDRTVELAKRYSFATVITEKNQGRAYARSAGFNFASSTIIARVDADSTLDANWVKLVKQNFTDDMQLQGVSGIARTAVLPYFNSPKSTFFSRAYYAGSRGFFKTETMWGANMAIRKSAWNKLKNKISKEDREAHEDQDLSLWMASERMKLKVDESLVITVSGQEYRFLPKLTYYIVLQYVTRKIHRRYGNYGPNKIITIQRRRLVKDSVFGTVAGVLLYSVSLLIFPIDCVSMLIKRLTK